MKKVMMFLIISSLLLAACTQPASTQTGSGKEPGSSSGTVKEFRIKATHAGGFNPIKFEANKGDTVRFLATSDPLFHEHGLTISEYGISVKFTAGDKDLPQVVEFVADKEGEFLIWCGTCLTGPLGEHSWMIAKLTIKP